MSSNLKVERIVTAITKIERKGDFKVIEVKADEDKYLFLKLGKPLQLNKDLHPEHDRPEYEHTEDVRWSIAVIVVAVIIAVVLVVVITTVVKKTKRSTIAKSQGNTEPVLNV